MIRRRSWPWAWWVVLCGVGCDACQGCGAGDVVAELSRIEQQVQRDRASAVGRWQPGRQGDSFWIGDGVRTGAQSRAILQLIPDGELVVESDTVVRFADRAPGQQAAGLSVEAGEVVLESEQVPLDVITALGVARIDQGSRVRMRTDGQQQHLEVLLGRVQVHGTGEVLSLAKGERVVIDVGRATIESIGPIAVEPAASGQDAGAGTSSSGADAGAPNAEGITRSPTRVKLTIPAGESAVVHDPLPPTRVRLALENCLGQVEVEVASPRRPQRIRGRQGANLQLGPGRHPYRVRCIDAGERRAAPVASGTLWVLRDAARQRLPLKPQAVQLDADGLKYTVRYANLLPQITLRWPSAPSAASYTLRVVSEQGNELTRQVSEPQLRFPAGHFPEGGYRFHFQAQDGRRSPESRLRIEFDNTTRSAYLSAPPEGFSVDGGPIRVAGAALARSKVSVAGQPAPLDRVGRFSLEVAPQSELEALAVRVLHPTTGIHYYLRHAGSTAN